MKDHYIISFSLFQLFEDIVDLLDPQFNIQDLHEELDEQNDMYSMDGPRSGYSGSETMFKTQAEKGCVTSYICDSISCQV